MFCVVWEPLSCVGWATRVMEEESYQRLYILCVVSVWHFKALSTRLTNSEKWPTQRLSCVTVHFSTKMCALVYKKFATEQKDMFNFQFVLSVMVKMLWGALGMCGRVSLYDLDWAHLQPHWNWGHDGKSHDFAHHANTYRRIHYVSRDLVLSRN